MQASVRRKFIRVNVWKSMFGKLKFSKLKAEIDNLRHWRINQFDISPSILPHDPREHRTFNIQRRTTKAGRTSRFVVES